MTVQNATVPVLRYFDCRSRGQALRFALTGAGQTFEDVRVPIADLALFRNNAHRPEVGGPFAALPVLDWNGHTVAQTLAIAAYLDRALFSAQARSSEYQSWLESIINAAHLDMQAPYSAVMWLPEDCSDTQLGAASKSLFEQLTARLAQLEVLHSRADPPKRFMGEASP